MSINTFERLSNYGFTPETAGLVGDIAEQQQAADFADNHQFAYDLQPVNPTGSDIVRILDMRPKDHDADKAMFYHLPFLNPLDGNQRFQLETIGKALPDTRIIAFGNPSGGSKYSDGGLGYEDRKKVISGDLRPTIEPALRYAEQEGITSTQQVGYSFGADKAVEAAASDAYEVTRTISIEPASLAKDALFKKLAAFGATNAMLDHYVELSQTPAFEDVRKKSVGTIAVAAGMFRPTNIAIGRSLINGGHLGRAERAIHNHPENHLAEVWGTESELAEDARMRLITKSLSDRYPGQVSAMPIVGGKHMIANDIYFHAAAVREFAEKN